MKIKNRNYFVAVIFLIIIWAGFFLFEKNIDLTANLSDYNKEYELNAIIEKIEKWDLAKINKKYKIPFPVLDEIVEIKKEEIATNSIKVTFTANKKWKWDSLHEFIYVFKIKDWKVASIEEYEK